MADGMSGRESKFISTVVGKPGSGKATIKYRSGAVSGDLLVAKFFMAMQDGGRTLDEARAYAKIGPMTMPAVDWTEVNRILDTFQAKP